MALGCNNAYFPETIELYDPEGKSDPIKLPNVPHVERYICQEQLNAMDILCSSPNS